VRCYACGKTRHMSWECPERKKKEGGGEAHISEAQRRNVEAEATRRWEIPHDEENSLKAREGGEKTSSEEQSIQDYLQDQGQGMQGDHRQWEH
jgi:hypothetical protein